MIDDFHLCKIHIYRHFPFQLNKSRSRSSCWIFHAFRRNRNKFLLRNSDSELIRLYRISASECDMSYSFFLYSIRLDDETFGSIAHTSRGRQRRNPFAGRSLHFISIRICRPIYFEWNRDRFSGSFHLIFLL